jgi:hypothetical protein
LRKLRQARNTWVQLEPGRHCRGDRRGHCITFLNKAGVTLSCRGSKKIPAFDTCKSLGFNLDVGSITLCLVPQLFMLEAPHFYFLFFLFAACWGRPRYPPWLRMLCGLLGPSCGPSTNLHPMFLWTA